MEEGVPRKVARFEVHCKTLKDIYTGVVSYGEQSFLATRLMMVEHVFDVPIYPSDEFVLGRSERW
jgi:hypothetical protein